MILIAMALRGAIFAILTLATPDAYQL